MLPRLPGMPAGEGGAQGVAVGWGASQGLGSRPSLV